MNKTIVKKTLDHTNFIASFENEEDAKRFIKKQNTKLNEFYKKGGINRPVYYIEENN